MRNPVAVGSQNAHEVSQQCESIVERVQFGDLAANMHVDTDNLEPLELGGTHVDLACATDWNAELVLGFAGRNLVMRFGIDIGINAYRNGCRSALRRGD